MLQMALIAVLVAGATGLGGFVYGVNVGQDKATAAQARVEDVVNKAAEAVANRAADAIAQIEITNKTIYQKATHEVRTNTVYADCVNTDGMFDNLNRSLRRPQARAGAGGVSGPDGAAGKGLRVHDAEAHRGGGPVLQVPGGGAGGK